MHFVIQLGLSLLCLRITFQHQMLKDSFKSITVFDQILVDCKRQAYQTNYIPKI